MKESYTINSSTSRGFIAPVPRTAPYCTVTRTPIRYVITVSSCCFFLPGIFFVKSYRREWRELQLFYAPVDIRHKKYPCRLFMVGREIQYSSVGTYMLERYKRSVATNPRHRGTILRCNPGRRVDWGCGAPRRRS